ANSHILESRPLAATHFACLVRPSSRNMPDRVSLHGSLLNARSCWDRLTPACSGISPGRTVAACRLIATGLPAGASRRQDCGPPCLATRSQCALLANLGGQRAVTRTAWRTCWSVGASGDRRVRRGQRRKESR